MASYPAWLQRMSVKTLVCKQFGCSKSKDSRVIWPAHFALTKNTGDYATHGNKLNAKLALHVKTKSEYWYSIRFMRRIAWGWITCWRIIGKQNLHLAWKHGWIKVEVRSGYWGTSQVISNVLFINMYRGDTDPDDFLSFRQVGCWMSLECLDDWSIEFLVYEQIMSWFWALVRRSHQKKHIIKSNAS